MLLSVIANPADADALESILFTETGTFGVRRQLIELDTAMLTECRRLYAIARNTASRLETFNGLRAEVLYHPPVLADRITAGPPQDYILSVGRLESVKRHDLAIRAMAGLPSPRRLVFVGHGTQYENLRRLTACAQACPAQAITFGDLNDPTSEVARLHKRPRSTRLLEELGTRPRVVYLRETKWKE